MICFSAVKPVIISHANRNIKFNYCILDEGHVIKNGKTKLSKAIKQLSANYRVILSGTPIQVSVELPNPFCTILVTWNHKYEVQQWGNPPHLNIFMPVSDFTNGVYDSTFNIQTNLVKIMDFYWPVFLCYMNSKEGFFLGKCWKWKEKKPLHPSSSCLL